VLESLLAAAVGGVLVITGTLASTVWQATSAKNTQRVQIAREDRYRLARDRIAAYTTFLQAAGSTRQAMAYHAGQDRGTANLLKSLRGQRNELWDAFTVVALIGDEDTRRAANDILVNVDQVAWRHVPFDPEAWSQLIGTYMRAARAELTAADMQQSALEAPLAAAVL
jgi:hypothetical protein